MIGRLLQRWAVSAALSCCAVQMYFRYKQLEHQVATIIQRYDEREATLRQNLRKTHVGTSVPNKVPLVIYTRS